MLEGKQEQHHVDGKKKKKKKKSCTQPNRRKQIKCRVGDAF